MKSFSLLLAVASLPLATPSFAGVSDNPPENIDRAAETQLLRELFAGPQKGGETETGAACLPSFSMSEATLTLFSNEPKPSSVFETSFASDVRQGRGLIHRSEREIVVDNLGFQSATKAWKHEVLTLELEDGKVTSFQISIGTDVTNQMTNEHWDASPVCALRGLYTQKSRRLAHK